MTEQLITTDDLDHGERLDSVIARRAGIPRSRAAHLIEIGAVTRKGDRVAKSLRVSAGQSFTVTDIPEAEESYEVPTGVGVVFEDDHLVVVDKPSGLVVHTAPSLHEATLVDFLQSRGTPLAPRGGEDRPGIVHRLDREVSGLLVVAKTDEVHEALVGAISRREVSRQYLALVGGTPEVDRGKIDAPVGRHPRLRSRMSVHAAGKPSVTLFHVLKRFESVSLLEVTLETGRTHQIRVHLASISHPVMGDRVYGPTAEQSRAISLDRPFLHAARLSFVHPVTGDELVHTSELPEDLKSVLDGLEAS